MIGDEGFETGLGGSFAIKLESKSFGSRAEISSGKGAKSLSSFGGLRFQGKLWLYW